MDAFLVILTYQGTIFKSTGPSKRIAETNVAMKVLAHIKELNE